jgi:hypothetical protein
MTVPIRNGTILTDLFPIVADPDYFISTTTTTILDDGEPKRSMKEIMEQWFSSTTTSKKDLESNGQKNQIVPQSSPDPITKFQEIRPTHMKPELPAKLETPKRKITENSQVVDKRVKQGKSISRCKFLL